MSERYVGAWEQAGLFNPLVAPTPSTYYNLYTWGNNNAGQLGLGNTTNYSSPMQVGSGTKWSAIGGGSDRQGYALQTNGTLWSWGLNQYGQLGLNTANLYYSSPKQVGALTNWLKITSNYGYATAIKTDGTLWSWGYNNYGQLGLNNRTNYSSPMQVGALTNWLNISAGYFYCIATKTDGTLWSWGNNNYGQLGLNNRTFYSSPKQVGSLTNWLSVAAGFYSNLAIKTDGTLWSWGYNSVGALGLNNTTYYSSPKQVGALTNWKTLPNNSQSSAAIKTDGTLWTWGYNGSGQLGLGNKTNYSSPKQVGSLTNWSSICTGTGQQTLAIKTDGTLWAWGRSVGGILGLGNTTTYSSPKQVGLLTSWFAVRGNGVFSIALSI